MSTNDLNVDVRLPRPRIRTGAVVWGLIVTVVGGASLYLLLSPERRAAALDWLLSFNAFGIGLAVLALLGVVLLVTALVVIIRRAQTRSELRHAEALAGDAPAAD